MVLMIKTEPVQDTVKWEIKTGRGRKRAERGGRMEESKQGYKDKGMPRG